MVAISRLGATLRATLQDNSVRELETLILSPLPTDDEAKGRLLFLHAVIDEAGHAGEAGAVLSHDLEHL